MAIFQKPQRESLASVTIKAIFTLILGLLVEHKEITAAVIRSEGNTAVRPACPTSSKATQTAPPFTVNQRRARTDGSQGACGRPGQLPHADQDIQSIPSSPATTTLPPPQVPVDLKTAPLLATCESPAGQFVAAVFSAICSLTSPVPPGKAQKTGSAQFLQVGRWLAGKRSPEEGTQFSLSRPHQVRSFTLEIIN